MKRTTIVALALATLLAGTSSDLSAQSGDPKKRLQIAEQMFQERCKKSGEFIHRTVDNVEGIFLMKIRPEKANFDNQFELDDPYGRDLGGEGYIKNFLLGRTAAGSITHEGNTINGYDYVEAIDPIDGKRYRYMGRIDEPWQRDKSYLKGHTRFVLNRAAVSGSIPRFGVTYDDISTREERKYWIAGSSLKVIDLKTNEVIAERIGYMMDRGQGSTSGGRSPWLLAAYHACPGFPTTPGGQPFKMDQTRDFVEKVLHIKQEK